MKKESDTNKKFSARNGIIGDRVISELQKYDNTCAVYSIGSVRSNEISEIKKSSVAIGVKVTFVNRKVAFLVMSKFLKFPIKSDVKQSIIIAYSKDPFSAVAVDDMKAISKKVQLLFIVSKGAVMEKHDDLRLLDGITSKIDLYKKILSFAYRPVYLYKSLLTILNEKSKDNV